MTVQVFPGDSREVLRGFADGSVDSVVTDPPYELGFMGKAWDAAGIAYDVSLWAECLRVLKPGGHLLAFGGTRTYHRMACAIEDAGFEIRDSINWLYGSGFPKSRNLSGDWEGWGTALKPAHEPIVVARKPLAGTVAETVLEFGTGALNIEGTRIAAEAAHAKTWDRVISTNIGAPGNRLISNGTQREIDLSGYKPSGRWPANLVFTHSAGCQPVGERVEVVGGGAQATSGFVDGYSSGDGFVGREVRSTAWVCVPGCPVGVLDEQSGDPEGVSRYFGVSSWDPDLDVPFMWHKKAMRKERTHDGMVDNRHPTVKPVGLMRWLVRLVTPPGGVVLDPFTGSGTTLVAGVLEGMNVIGVELTEDYIPIIEQRVAAAGNLGERARPVRAATQSTEAAEDEQRLF